MPHDEWLTMPIPRRLHRCRAATTGTLGGLLIRRCPCGGIRIDNGPWLERNTRKA